MGKMFVISNPMPLHNNSPAISLGKFVQVICAAGYSPEIIGARFPKDGIPGVSDTVSVRSYSYGGKSVFKLLSFIFLQIRTFFSCLVRFRKGDPVYFWIADKMIGPFLAARIKKCEINYFLYGKVFGDGIGGFSEKLIRFMMNRASYVCTESPSVLDQWDVSESKHRDSINLFVPENDIGVTPYNERKKTVAMYCRLSVGKHIDDSVRAFCKLHSKMPEYSLKIIGGGPLYDETVKLIEELSAGDFITVTGWLEHDRAMRELSECALLLYPTDAEGVPGGILEAMSLGVPPLASPAGGIPDIITDGVDGIILPSADEKSIETALENVVLSGSLEDMSIAAIEKICERFSLEGAALNFKTVRESHNSER